MRMRRTLAVVAALMLAAPASASIYGIKSKSLSGSGPYQYEPPAILYRFADDGTGLTSLGYIRSSDGTQLRADGLAFAPGSGLWFFEPSAVGAPVASTLRPLDLQTAVAGDGINLVGRHVFGAAFDSLGGLWALDQEEDELIRVEPTTGQILDAVGLMLDGAPFDLEGGAGDIAFDSAGQAWITHEDSFYHADLSTGSLTLQDTVNGISLWMVGAAFSPLDESHLYVFDVSIGWYNDDLLRFDVDDGFSRYDVALEIFDQYNAGRGDLAYVPEPSTLVLVAAGCLGMLLRRR